VPLDLIAVGDVMLDGALPAPVPGRRVHGTIELRPGGSAANAALAAVRLGASAAVVGRIGRDAAGRLVADDLAAAGVEVLLARDEAAPTGSVVVLGGSAIVAGPGASALLAPEDLPEPLEARAILVSGYSLLQAGPEAAARAALARARTEWLAVDTASANLVTVFGVERFYEATAQAGVVLANDEEALALTGLHGEAAALKLGRRYGVACVKLGSDGAVAASAGVTARVTVPPIEGASTLGAGDSFAAGLLLALAGGAELAAALQAGCDAAEAAIASRAVSPTSRA
jgi:sugar/nucleoside kinase (ribokinase family)